MDLTIEQAEELIREEIISEVNGERTRFDCVAGSVVTGYFLTPSMLTERELIELLDYASEREWAGRPHRVLSPWTSVVQGAEVELRKRGRVIES